MIKNIVFLKKKFGTDMAYDRLEERDTENRAYIGRREGKKD